MAIVELTLYRIQNNRHLRCMLKDGKLEIVRNDLSESETEHIDRKADLINGCLIAVFTLDNKNYINLHDKIVELTPEIDIEYDSGDANERGWVKIFKHGTVIYETKYINNRKPYIDFASGFEDWEVVNFAWHLAGYIDKVKEDPEVILFRLLGKNQYQYTAPYPG